MQKTKKKPGPNSGDFFKLNKIARVTIAQGHILTFYVSVQRGTFYTMFSIGTNVFWLTGL